MNLYYVVIKDLGPTLDEWPDFKTASLDEAIKYARNEWERMTRYSRRHYAIEVRQYAEDIEDDECQCFDYDTFEWKEN